MSAWKEPTVKQTRLIYASALLTRPWHESNDSETWQRRGGRRETERESEDGGENKDEVKANLERKMEGEATARGEPVRLRAAVDGARREGNKRSMWSCFIQTEPSLNAYECPRLQHEQTPSTHAGERRQTRHWLLNTLVTNQSHIPHVGLNRTCMLCSTKWAQRLQEGPTLVHWLKTTDELEQSTSTSSTQEQITGSLLYIVKCAVPTPITAQRPEAAADEWCHTAPSSSAGSGRIEINFHQRFDLKMTLGGWWYNWDDWTSDSPPTLFPPRRLKPLNVPQDTEYCTHHLSQATAVDAAIRCIYMWFVCISVFLHFRVIAATLGGIQWRKSNLTGYVCKALMYLIMNLSLTGLLYT